MTRALAILSLCAVACTTTQVRRVRADCQPCDPCIAEEGPTEIVTVKSARAAPVVRLPPLPTAPQVTPEEAVPAGCPPAFLRCLTADQDAAWERYGEALKSWEKTVKGRVCQHVECR